MASLSNDEFEYSLPEMVFHECIILSGSQKAESCTKCPLCSEYAAVFHCANCVRSGDFTHSSKTLERFAEKKHKIYKIEEEKAHILAKYESAFAKKVEIENVKYKIARCKENIRILKANIDIYKNELSKGKRIIDSYNDKKSKSKDVQVRLALKLRKCREYHKLEHASFKLKESDLCSKQCALKTVMNHRVKELITHIFPITEVPPQYHRDTSLSEEDQYAELEEAQKTTYVQGQWVIAGSPMDDMQYKIVEPCIPSTGDYSAYPAWCTSFANMTSGADHIEGISRDNLSNVDKYRFDVAYGISGSLSYTAQLVNILAFYLDVHLPKRSSINDFNRGEYVDKFYHNVAKLDANIIHLCLSQQVDVSELSAHRTISNLLLLIGSKKKDSKRYLSFEEQEERLESLEDSIFRDLPFYDESDNENSEGEFVHVSDEDIIEVPETVPIANPPESLYSSVVSFWRAAIGQK